MFVCVRSNMSAIPVDVVFIFKLLVFVVCYMFFSTVFLISLIITLFYSIIPFILITPCF